MKAPLIPVLAAVAAMISNAASAAATALPDVRISGTKFVLDNGLTVVVHEDHKAPIVAVNVWYHVGSKDEPPGRTGFAHLFEHLMFAGADGTQKEWFARMEALGATEVNGTTNHDRTNFFETVPTAAVGTALQLEAGRMRAQMEHFSDKVLIAQRDIVRNEERQHESRPYGLSEEIIAKAVWPVGHPYGHTVGGDPADLEATRVTDLKDWFAKYYAPSNATLALAGDLTPAQGRELAEQYFAAIPAGAPIIRHKVWVPRRFGRQFMESRDRVPQPRLYMIWNIPGWGTADSDYLRLLGDILANGKSSRLQNRLLYEDRLAVDVSAEMDARELAGMFIITVTARAGVPLPRVEAAVDAELQRLLRDGPTLREIARARVQRVAHRLRAAERVGSLQQPRDLGGKSEVLAAAQTYGDSPDAWRPSFERERSATGADLIDAGRKWLTDGVFTLHINPFPDLKAVEQTRVPAESPGLHPAGTARFVPFRRALLANGLKLIVAERQGLPMLQLGIVLDGGSASDPPAKPGTAALVAALLDEGTASLDSRKFNDRLLDLGAQFQASVNRVGLFVTLSVPAANLKPSLDLLAQAVRHPALCPDAVEHERSVLIASIQQQKRNPLRAALRLEPKLIFGAADPSGRVATESTLASITAHDLAQYHSAFFEPSGATLIVVGDTTLDEILPDMEARFGGWQPKAHTDAGVTQTTLPTHEKVYLIDQPGSVQSAIVAGSIILSRAGSTDAPAMEAVNSVVGGAFTSRLNMNLREDKHWSYNPGSSLDCDRRGCLFTAQATVQTDRTAESLVEMQRELRELVATRQVTAEEAALAQRSLGQSLAARWETNAGISDSLSEIVSKRLPDDYFTAYGRHIIELDRSDLLRVAPQVVHPDRLIWIIVGDRAKIGSRLQELGLAVQSVDADGEPVDTSNANHQQTEPLRSKSDHCAVRKADPLRAAVGHSLARGTCGRVEPVATASDPHSG